MPTVKVNGVELFYKESGSGAETIVFSHGLLMDHTMFEPQRAAFESKYRVIAYDHRGQGQSADPGWGHDMDMLALDASALVRTLGAAPCHFAGLSMGGFVGMRLAARHPGLVRTLTLMNTGARKENPGTRLRYGTMARIASIFSIAPFVPVAVKELFGHSTRHDPTKAAMVQEWTAKLRSRPRNIASSVLAVVNRPEFVDELSLIRCPVLVIAGEDDTAQPPKNSEHLASQIRNSWVVRIPKCGHSSSLEQPEAVIEAMRELMSGAGRA
ncbi:MAG TPA: alpha/beta hydrolase [Alphaproteobacteria bacterium]|nr:alpha/beta hydrolase [Alphaproteobacteria bacterium]